MTVAKRYRKSLAVGQGSPSSAFLAWFPGQGRHCPEGPRRALAAPAGRTAQRRWGGCRPHRALAVRRRRGRSRPGRPAAPALPRPGHRPVPRAPERRLLDAAMTSLPGRSQRRWAGPTMASARAPSPWPQSASCSAGASSPSPVRDGTPTCTGLWSRRSWMAVVAYTLHDAGVLAEAATGTPAVAGRFSGVPAATPARRCRSRMTHPMGEQRTLSPTRKAGRGRCCRARR